MSESPADRAEHMLCLWESLSPDPDKVLPPTPERFEDVRTVEELELWLMANQRTPNAAEREAMRQQLGCRVERRLTPPPAARRLPARASISSTHAIGTHAGTHGKRVILSPFRVGKAVDNTLGAAASG